MLRSEQVDEWPAEAEQRGLILGADRMAYKKSSSAEQARQEVIAEFGPVVAAILDRA
jgi:hypothetical protein